MQQSPQNILVPIDFSAAGNHALLTAIELCEKHEAVLHLLHVQENRYIITEPEPDMALPAILKVIDEASRTELYHVYESIISNYAVSVQIHMPTGIPFDEICKAADAMPIDLIVMGTHGASGFREFSMGTTAYNVIKNTTKPVLTIPTCYHKKAFHNILFPLRAVQGVQEKFDFLSTLLTDKAAVAFHIATLCGEDDIESLIPNENIVQSIISYCTQNHILYTKETYMAKNLAAQVLQLAATHNTDLIVINATLDYNWAQFFIGPYTQQVVNHAKVPVLSFRQAIDVATTVKREAAEAEVKKYAGL